MALHPTLCTVAQFAALWEAGEAVSIALQRYSACLSKGLLGTSLLKSIKDAVGVDATAAAQRCWEAQTSRRVLPRAVGNIFLVECRRERLRVEGVVQLVVGWPARGGFLARGPLAPPPPPLPLPPGEGS